MNTLGLVVDRNIIRRFKHLPSVLSSFSLSFPSFVFRLHHKTPSHPKVIYFPLLSYKVSFSFACGSLSLQTRTGETPHPSFYRNDLVFHRDSEPVSISTFSSLSRFPVISSNLEFVGLYLDHFQTQYYLHYLPQLRSSVTSFRRPTSGYDRFTSLPHL